jgi:hypothetical protein
MRFPLLIIAALLPLCVHGAALYHLSMDGAGKRDGLVWSSSFPASEINRVINEVMQPGDQLQIAPGVYQDVTIRIENGGSPGKPKVIYGLDHGQGLPVFASDWSENAPEKGQTTIHLGEGASHVTMERLRLKGAKVGVYAPKTDSGAARQGLRFIDVDIAFCRHGYYLSDCQSMLLERLDLKRYTKHGFRLEESCSDVVIKNCTADCSEGDAAWETKTESLPFGFLVNDVGRVNARISFENCLARNHMMPLQKRDYKNGDGFVVEAGAEQVHFIRCRAIRNQDGGYDIKSRGVELRDSIAIGNARNFRIWNGGTLHNCLAAFGSVGLWSNGSSVDVQRSTFHGHQQAALMLDDEASEAVTLTDCLISDCAATHAAEPMAKVKLVNTVVTSDPNYVNASATWDGLGTAMNSVAYPNQGYRATSVPVLKNGRR